MQAAVDADGLAVDPVPGGAGDEGDRFGDVAGSAQSFEGNGVGEDVDLLGRLAF